MGNQTVAWKQGWDALALETALALNECNEFITVTGRLKQRACESRKRVAEKIGRCKRFDLFMPQGYATLDRQRQSMAELYVALSEITLLYDRALHECRSMQAILVELTRTSERQRSELHRNAGLGCCVGITLSSMSERRADVAKIADTLFVLTTQLEESHHAFTLSECAIGDSIVP
jgi:hypothetical protein